MNNGTLTPFVLRWWWVLLASTLLAAGGGYGYGTQIAKTYEAETQLLVGPLNTTTDLDASGTLARTYAQLGEGRRVLAAAIDAVGAKLTPIQLGHVSTIESNEVTRIISVRVQDSDPKRAALLANAIAARIVEMSSLRRARASSGLDAFEREPEIVGLPPSTAAPVLAAAERVFSGSTAGLVHVTETAQAPKDPVKPSIPLFVIVAAIGGLLLAVAAAMAWESMHPAEAAAWAAPLAATPSPPRRPRTGRTAAPRFLGRADHRSPVRGARRGPPLVRRARPRRHRSRAVMIAHRLSIVPPIAVGAILRPPLKRIVYPLADRYCSHTARVSDALLVGARELGLGSGDEVLVPAQHAVSAVLALRQAGLDMRLYTGTPRLAPDSDELEALLTPAVRALYVVHHLGFPQDVERWRTWCDDRGLLLVEDATHALAACAGGLPVGSLADMAVFGLAECLGVPDGAVLRLNRELRGAVPAGELGVAALARRLMTGASSNDVAAGPAADGDRGASAVAMRLLWRLADERSAAARRSHYAQLLEQLGDRVPAPFDRLAPGAAPYALPLRLGADDRLGDRLRDRGVQALSGWPAPRDALLVPVHHELLERDVERILDATVVRRSRRAREELALEPLSNFEALADDWQRLAQEAGTIFATPQWLATWWRHYGRDGTLRLYACRDRRGRVAAILALEIRAAGPVSVMRFAGHGPSDQLGPLCATDDRPAVARALLRAIDEAGADVLLGEQIAGDSGWHALLGARVLSREGNPVTHFCAAGWDAQLRRWTPSIGRQLGRHTRKLERSHDVRIRRTATATELERDLDSLFALHEARWGVGKTAFGTPDAAFHREFAATALEHGWLQLSFLELDGKPVAAVYNLRFAGAEHQYQQGRLPEWERHSVGTIALLRSMRFACDEGMREFRFLRGGEDYKYRYADADPGLHTIAVAGRPGAAGALAIASAVRRNLLKPARRWAASA